MSDGKALVWDDAYAVGNAQLDAQHRELFDIAHSLIGIKVDPGAAYLHLHAQVRSHFSHEESLMRRIGYPGLPHHEDEHDRLIGLLTSVRSEIAGGDWGIDAMCAFFSRWLIDHIGSHDRPLAKFVRATVHGGSDAAS